MKSKIISFLIIIPLILIFIILYKGLNKSKFYEPKSKIENIPEFTAITFFKKKKVNTQNIFFKDKFYLLNIWASWCVPCKDEHPLLVSLSNNDQLEIMGADIATTFLSEGRRSRLVKRLREELQIVESIDMDITILEKGGLIMLEACCVEEQVDQVEKEITKVLSESSLTIPSSNEINRAYQLVKNYLCFRSWWMESKD